MKKRILIGGGVVVLAAVVIGILRSESTPRKDVDVGKVVRKELVSTVTASGTIDPQRSVDVSANVIGKVTKLAVDEGDTVRAGDFLLEIDPAEYQAAVRALEAAVSTARADLKLAEASAEKAEQDLRRAEQLHAQGLHSVEQIEAARTAARVEEARLEGARSRLYQQQANLDRAHYDLDKVTVTAPMSGIVTRLNVEEGENAIMGTLNNPGTVLLVIADLAIMEARVKVDETEVVKVAMGQPAKIEIDAFPDTTFAGHVTEIGNSPIYTSAGSSQQAVDFEVKVVLDERIPNVRPGLSAKADIEVARRPDAIAVPLGSVTVRKWPPEPKLDRRGRRGRRAAAHTAAAAADSTGAAPDSVQVERKDLEGVFVVADGEARFRPVKLGVAGEDDFEVLGGLEEGETVVTGPFRVLRELENGDAVKTSERGDRRDANRDRD